LLFETALLISYLCVSIIVLAAFYAFALYWRELDKPQYALRPLQLRTKAATLKKMSQASIARKRKKQLKQLLKRKDKRLKILLPTF
jgi:hypothetical protein